jgi:hypothetical protein
MIRDPHGDIVRDVLQGLPEMARNRAEDVLQMSWESLSKLGYQEIQVEVWDI